MELMDRRLKFEEILEIKRMRSQDTPFNEIARELQISEERVRIISDALNRKRRK